MQELPWMPSNTPNSKAVGRFVDEIHHHTNREGVKCSRNVTLLYTKIPGSNDVSSQLVKDNPDGRKLKEDYSRAWELYEKSKAAAPAPEPTPTATEFGIKGIPIEELDFIGKDRMATLKAMGFLLAEQVADMSDTDCNNVGHGAKSWRKKAKDYIALKKAS